MACGRASSTLKKSSTPRPMLAPAKITTHITAGQTHAHRILAQPAGPDHVVVGARSLFVQKFLALGRRFKADQRGLEAIHPLAAAAWALAALLQRPRFVNHLVNVVAKSAL